MPKEQKNGTKGNANPQFTKAKAGQMKEEISMELAELGNMTPKQEPMTPNERDKSEKEKWYG